MKKKYLSLALLVLLVHLNLHAQDNEIKEHRVVQVTFAYPIASNGANSMEYTSNFSLNILFGFNGGVQGAEIGSVFNYNDGDVSGGQLAGVANINTGSTKGLMLSGVLNYSRDSLTGAQISTVNCISDRIVGLQLGVINYTPVFRGLQLGVINVGNKLRGLQFGVVNIANDAETGTSFGLINVVRGGLFEFELAAGEVLFANLNYKMGTDRVYTIYKVGFSSFNSMKVNSYGLGFGTTIHLGARSMLNIDLSGNQIVLDDDFDSELNILSKLDLNYKFALTEFLTFLVGPSLNVYVSEVPGDNGFGTLNIPYTINSIGYSRGNVDIWAGFNAGISFRL